ncbi:MAG: hypothetical protein ACI3ZN_06235 [Candidatus Cryptobacteroides sp.]
MERVKNQAVSCFDEKNGQKKVEKKEEVKTKSVIFERFFTEFYGFTTENENGMVLLILRE